MAKQITQEAFDKACELFDRIEQLTDQIKSATTLNRKLALIRQRDILRTERYNVIEKGEIE